MNNKTPKYIAAIVIFMLFLALFLYLTFPTGALKKRVTSEIENSTGFTASISDVSISPFLELTIKDLNLIKEQRNINVKIDSLQIKPSLLSVFTDNKKIPFDARIGKGRIKGALVYSSKTKNLDSVGAELRSIHTDLITSFTKSGSDAPKFDGHVDGEIKVNFNSAANSRSTSNINGVFELDSKDMSIENLKVQGLTLPAYKDLLVNLDGTIKGNKTLIDRLSFENKDFDLMLAGSMPLIWEIKKGGKLDLSLNLNLKTDKAKMGFLQAFMNKQTDGTLSAKIGGTASQPKFLKGEKL